jgi:uncharacterized protein
MGPELVFNKFMQGGISRNLVKGGTIYLYMRSPFLVWCERFAPREEKDPHSDYMELIMENGRVFEDTFCEDSYPEAVQIDPRKHEAAFKEVLEAFFRGEKFIKNAILYNLPEGMVASPDVLVRTEGKSIFGDHHYEVIEIKSSKNIRKEHIMQAAFYNYIIGKMQGLTPEKFYLINGLCEKTSYDFSAYSEQLERVVDSIRSIYRDKEAMPEKVGWPWQEFSMKKLMEKKDISIIPNMFSAHAKTLRNNNINNINDFNIVDIEGIAGIDHPTLHRYKLFSKAFTEGRHFFLEKPFLPEAKTEIFMDFEGIENMKLRDKHLSGDYLIGMLVREGGKEEYKPLVAGNFKDEHKILIDFLKFIKDKKDYVIYHFGSYEKTHLSRMFQKYGVDDDLRKEVLESMVDLYPVIKKSVIFPISSYSLKYVGRYLGLKWRGEVNAQESIALYIRFLQTGEREYLDKVIKYNEDDCIATKRLKDFIVWAV